MAKSIPSNSGHGFKNNKDCAKQYICCFGELRELAVTLVRSPIMLFWIRFGPSSSRKTVDDFR